ncbi:MAG: primosomal protein N' [Blastocatellia bacterium]|nr:primosomal protein N' [Blastocatellia bacterium]
MKICYVEVALPVPLRRVFTYRVPVELSGDLKLGARIKLPFGRREMVGYAVGLHNELPPDLDIDESKLKDIAEILDEEPLITPEILRLTQWTADYYSSFWGEMLKASLPAGLNSETVRPKRRKAVRLRWSADTPVRMSVASTRTERGDENSLAGTTDDADEYARVSDERSSAHERSADTPVRMSVASTRTERGDESSLAGTTDDADKSVRTPVLEPRGWYYHGGLPHFDGEVVQFVTFRLGDSLPKSVLEEIRLRIEHGKVDLEHEKYRQEIEDYLDSGAGECILRDPRIAQILQETILEEAGSSIDLKAWVIMPNHAHILFRMLAGDDLAGVMKRIKGISARRINELLGRKGKVWQADYFDRFIRDGKHYARTFRYIESNPVIAKLVDSPDKWPFGSAFYRSADTPVRMSVVSTPRERGDESNLAGGTGDADKSVRTPIQQRIIDLLKANNGEMLFTDIVDQLGGSATPLNTLAKRGVVEIFVQDVDRDPLKNATIPARDDLTLTDEQNAAFTAITTALESKEYKGFLLHGVTGSGKTEVYIRAMKHALELGGSAMMLVPEIALTPVFSRRLRSVFGSKVAILHSNLSQGERYDEWRRIRRGDARIAIGTRSAVFAPLENISLVIVDEEHDPSYRQHESPFYNARDVAVMRASLAKAIVVLGSATPAMESFYNAQNGKYEYLALPERIGGRGLASAELVDMRDVFKRFGKDVALSPELIEGLTETLHKGEQSIVLLNRRGFSQFVLCRTCGETLKCKNCDITLTFHRGNAKLICHYCNYSEKVPKVCPHCKSEFLYFVGEGTENIADQLVARFPNARIERVDRDTMAHKGELDRVLLDFANHKIDMLVGTQMIAKGHDFPNVTLVGVIGIDIGLGLPDLRSAERTFQLITQVAGRSGRGEKPGRVLIQTYYPDHYALRHALAQDYLGFYKEEIRFRERLAYPPFVVLASILVKHRDHAYASKQANTLRRALDEANADRTVRILGPAPASLSRLKNEFRFQVILKATNRRHLRERLDFALESAERQGCDLRTINVEIDPVNLM